MSQKDYTSAKHSSECRWTGSVGNGQWNDPTNWSESILPGSADVVRFSGAIGDCEICIEDTITVGRIEMKTDSTDDRVVLTGGGTLILNGVDRLLGKPTTLQVMKGTLDFRNPLCVQVEGPPFQRQRPRRALGHLHASGLCHRTRPEIGHVANRDTHLLSAVLGTQYGLGYRHIEDTRTGGSYSELLSRRRATAGAHLQQIQRARRRHSSCEGLQARGLSALQRGSKSFHGSWKAS